MKLNLAKGFATMQLNEGNKSRWEQLLAPFYGVPEASRTLNVSEAEVVDRITGFELLGCVTSDGVTVLPAFQFEPALRDSLPRALRAFVDVELDNWTIAGWFVTDQPILNDVSPADWLSAGKDPGVVVEAAQALAARWKPEQTSLEKATGGYEVTDSSPGGTNIGIQFGSTGPS